jgi:quercetin dioxygenase-like cupin family protein
MQPTLIFILLVTGKFCFGQTIVTSDTLSAPSDFENVYSRKMVDDSLQTSYVIWIKKNVAEHYHEFHTENIYILEGKAEMTINGKKRVVKKGDYLNIPKGTRHAVRKVLSRKPLKVISIQSPRFDGTDRIIINPPHADF